MLNPYTQRALIKLLNELLAAVIAMPVNKTCPDCRHFQSDICTLANARPPEEVIRVGCEKYQFDDTRPPF